MGWQAWRLDAHTWAWIVWLGWFVAWETHAVVTAQTGTLTAHLRPLWLGHPLTWWLALGLWLWLGVHMADQVAVWISTITAAPSWTTGPATAHPAAARLSRRPWCHSASSSLAGMSTWAADRVSRVDRVRRARGESLADAILWGLRRYAARD